MIVSENADKHLCRKETMTQFLKYCTGLLLALATLLPHTIKAQQTFRVNNGSTKYDVKFTVPCRDYMCSGEAVVSMVVKSTDRVVIQMNFSNVHFALPKPLDTLLAQSTTGNIIHFRDFESPIPCADFDFDGYEDIAIPVNDSTCIFTDGATFDIYLFKPTENRFKPEQNRYILHNEITVLQHNSTATLGVNREKKRLISFAKEGCCWVSIAEYIWLGKGATKRLRVVSEYSVEDDYPNKNVTEIRHKLVNGKWVKKVKKYTNHSQ
jgi:hypothetical protein